MPAPDTRDPEWARLYEVYNAIPGGDELRAVTNTYWRLQDGRLYAPSTPTEAMREALRRHGYLRAMPGGAEEYEEIMKGAGIWDSIQNG